MRPTRQELETFEESSGLNVAKLLRRILNALISLASGTNPDGTAFSLLVEANGAFVDRSGTIENASQSQSCMAANAARRYLLIQNHGSADLWVNVEGAVAAAAQPSIRIPAGGFFEPLVAPRGAVEVLSTQQGLAYTAKEV